MFIDAQSEIPVYRQIVEQICKAIEAGVFRAGEALPSQRALAAELRVNPNTVQRAFDELMRDGVIESRRGLGVFVVERKSLQAKGAVEREAVKTFRQGIDAALGGGLTPARVRTLFESEMRRHTRSVRRDT